MRVGGSTFVFDMKVWRDPQDSFESEVWRDPLDEFENELDHLSEEQI